MIASPPRTLEGCTFAAANSTAGATAEFITRGMRSPQDDRDCASKRRMMLAALAP
jgi:hypothetical protein